MREYLSQRFRNLRRTSTPFDKSDHKKSVATILPSEQSHSMVCCLFIINFVIIFNFPQTDPPATDKTSYERNHDCLKTEYKKPNANHSIIKKLLQLPFETRRAEILACQISLTKIIELYPFFASKIWVRFDF